MEEKGKLAKKYILKFNPQKTKELQQLLLKKEKEFLWDRLRHFKKKK